MFGVPLCVTLSLMLLLVPWAAHGCACEWRRGVLMDLYNATNGAEWTDGVPWDFTNTVCYWSGVSCTSDVVELRLLGRNLRGTLPALLSELGNLTNFDLRNNSLSGSIPESYSAWRSMAIFLLGQNTLSGSLPAALSQWGSSLRQFIVFDNNFTGTLPAEYSNWTNIEWFSVGLNQLSGVLPESYANWTRVFQFSVYDNHFSGTLPSEYGQWGNHFNNLFASSNNFSGTIPAAYSAWSRLLEFEAHNNSFEGDFPNHFATVGTLVSLRLSDNLFSGTLNPKLGDNCGDLVTLELDHNHFDGLLPASYRHCVALTKLNINDNNVQGTLPPEFSDLVNLQQLDLSSNALNGTIPAEYHRLSSLTNFNVANNLLTGSLSPSFSRWGSILSFAASGNFLSGTLPSSFQAWSQLLVFSASFNQFEGTLPSEWGLAWAGVAIVMLDHNPKLSSLPSTWRSGMMAPWVGYLSVCHTLICGPDVVASRVGVLSFGCPSTRPTFSSTKASKILSAVASDSTWATAHACDSINNATTVPQTSNVPIQNVTTGALINRMVVPAAAGGAAVVLSALATKGAVNVPLLQFAAAGATLRAACEVSKLSDAAAVEGSDSITAVLSTAMDNPLQLNLATFGKLAESASGAVVGNVALVLLVGTALHGVGAAMQSNWCRRQRQGGDREERGRGAALFHHVVLSLFGASDVPSTFMPAYGALIEPTVAGCALLLAEQRSTNGAATGGSVALGVVGVLVALCLPLYVVWRFSREDPFPWRPIPRPEAMSIKRNVVDAAAGCGSSLIHSASRAFLNCVTNLLKFLSREQCEWVPATVGRRNRSRTEPVLFFRRFGAVFSAYRNGWWGPHWWWLADISNSFAGGLVTGIAYAQSDAPCSAATWSSAILAALSSTMALAYIAATPFNSTLDTFGTPFMAILATVVNLVVALEGPLDAVDVLTTLALVVEMVLIALGIACNALCDSDCTAGEDTNSELTIDTTPLPPMSVTKRPLERRPIRRATAKVRNRHLSLGKEPRDALASLIELITSTST